ncbi:MAG: undecaprenyl-phosphate glucose phosphotransferase [Candidatus Margulisiibacteriota bacterium]|nr:undecaprenyl-phosphate glucose phosphotransferase [Candidatus Margulisiibacteriota bacterium]
MLKIVLDIILINVSLILAYLIRFKTFIFLAPATVPVFEQYFRVLIFVTLIWLAIFKLIGLYEDKKNTALIDEVANVFLGVSVATLVLFALLFMYREFWFSRLVIANVWWISLICLTFSRIFLFSLKRLLRSKGIASKNLLILGAGEMGQLLALKVTQDKSLGYRVFGYLDDNPEKQGKEYNGYSVLGGIDKVVETVKNNKIEEVIIASTRISINKVLDVITECERYGVEFKIVPGILELIASRLDVDEIGGVPLLTVSEIQLKGLNAFLKRTTDVSFSFLGILALSPFFLLFALLVKTTSRGPVFFMQERVGLDGKMFKMFKFRSMVQDAEQLFPQLEPLSEAEGYLFKMKDDPRITPLGKFMRRWSIDEYPQLFNVLLGQMSLVGPRPPLPREVKNYSVWHKKRLRVRPGITGLWQVSGRSLLPFEDMVRLDIYYIENWSLWLDLKILLRTALVVFLGSGAY